MYVDFAAGHERKKKNTEKESTIVLLLKGKKIQEWLLFPLWLSRAVPLLSLYELKLRISKKKVAFSFLLYIHVYICVCPPAITGLLDRSAVE